MLKRATFILLSSLFLSACIPQSQPQAPANQTQEQSMKEYEKVAQAIQAGKSIKCVMTKKDDGSTMTSFVKGKKVKTVGIPADKPAETSTMISDSVYVYTWNDQKKEGVKFKIPEEKDVEATKEATQKVPDFSKEEDQKAYEEMGYTIACVVIDIGDDEFVPPPGIKFSDLSAMMEKTTQAPNTGAMTKEQQEAIQKQTEQLMKQYQGQ